MRTGRYVYDDGYPNNRTTNSFWWSRTHTGSSVYNLTIEPYYVQPNFYYSGTRGNGFAIRCTIRVE